ncbi:MAG TPA: bifunctional riboflavin kinase/FAD synthetase [Sphingomonas sanguinis]|uniref:bifunctional riboflavin kinase/FAD synthetase n=1 Tax=Sphingomonas sanguinis TaxID=33051 RepID=UPI002ABF9D15|nr:bifunctional riboflavin kinase/FAD synthetase [Sphingomonas sanguinis]HJO64790.1 bifunctional riboflavin kinase/FAD synthetase [Sphingomonas sanguinis]
MQRVDGAGAIPAHLAGGIVALGNFDGFHLGHQAVVGAAVARARAEGRPALVATFDPHPIRYFKPDAAPFRLTTLDQRERLFAAAGVDAMIVFGFDAELAALSAEAFVEQRLLAALKVGGVVTGEDFTFGRARSGDVNALRAWGRARGFSTDAVAPVRLDGETISSSRIRAALIAGDAETAARLLTRPYAIEGVVQHGDKLGRTIGYPTANLDMGEYLRPAYGIYAVRGRLDDGRVLDGAANLGIRPSFDPPKELLEPHFFDFAGDLYGRTVSVELIDYLRPEAKFDTLDALVTQMDADCARARQILSSHNPA